MAAYPAGLVIHCAKSRLAERYIDEGVRMDDHPGIVFRDGPTGRRAGLAASPDAWEVISALRSSGLDGDEGIEATAEWAGLTVRQVRDAIGYYSEYPAEIDERIRLNEEEADAAERALACDLQPRRPPRA